MKYEFRTTPYAHQREALVRSWDKEQYALLMEMGTGKTKVAIDNIGIAHHQGLINGALILANKGSYRNWTEEELPAHMPQGLLDESRIHVWRGVGSNRERDSIRAVTNADAPLAIMTMNVEALSHGDSALEVAEEFLKSKRCMLVLDESTQIKNPTAGRTKAVIRLGKFARMRRIMTGMPVVRSPLDLYSQFDFLKNGILGYTSWWVFRSKYAEVEDQWFMQNGKRKKVSVVVGYRNVSDLQGRLAPHSYRKLKSECLDLPPKTYERRTVDLTAEQRRVYNGIVADATAQLESGDHVTATEVITQLLRMHQVCCGFVVDENRTAHDLPETRTQALCDVMEDAGCRGVVWVAYRQVIPRIVAALGKMGRVVEYHGGTPPEARIRNMHEFQDGLADFFVGTPHTGGHGITLTAGSTTVYHSNTYNLELRAQSEDRTHRIGQREKCTYVDLVAPGTIDEKFLTVLRSKIDLATAVTGDGYREWVV